MLLAVDVGNSQTHLGVFSGEKLTADWRMSTDARRTSDELALVIQQLLAFQDLSFSRQVTGVAISSVVPSLTGALRDMVETYFHFEPLVVEAGIKTGMAVLTDNPKEVGADRIVNAVAAYSMVGGPVIVIDFGTATTFDAVSDKGELLGCSIAPGIQISANALFGAAAQIQKIELHPQETVIGKSTASSVRAGIVLGTVAMVEGMVQRMQTELGGFGGVAAPRGTDPGAPEAANPLRSAGGAEIVATGGLAPLILEHCQIPIRHEPYLTLMGLRILYERNVQDS